MSVEYDTSASSSSTLTDILSFKENKIHKNHVSCKKCHYICLGALADILQLKVRRKCAYHDNFVVLGIKYIEDMCRRTHKYVCGQSLGDDFLKSVIASVALFLVGMKLTDELAAWKVS